MVNTSPIASNNELCDMLTCIPEKFVVDFANGIDVARDHIRTQQKRTGFYSRLYDGFTGQGGRRQTEINGSLADGLEGSLVWLNELTESLAKSNYALSRVNQRVASIQVAITSMAHYSANTRDKMADLSRNLNFRLDHVLSETLRIDFEQRAERQLEQVFNKWAAGRFSKLSFAGRCYAALEELRWGVFGDYCRKSSDNHVRQGFLDDLANRAIHQLNIDAKPGSLNSRVPVEAWIAPIRCGASIDATDALAYVGDWSEPDPHPFVYTTTQLPRQLPDGLPRLCTAERVAEALVSEVYDPE